MWIYSPAICPAKCQVLHGGAQSCKWGGRAAMTATEMPAFHLLLKKVSGCPEMPEILAYLDVIKAGKILIHRWLNCILMEDELS